MEVKPVNQGPFDIAINESDHIVLSVTIGNAQIGGNVVLINNKQIGKGEIKHFDLGLGSDLIGDTLTIFTNVLDVNPGSNRISITHFFFNGNPTVFSFPPLAKKEMEVDNDGDVLSLNATYQFVKL
jgi:hypothetical protein